MRSKGTVRAVRTKGPWEERANHERRWRRWEEQGVRVDIPRSCTDVRVIIGRRLSFPRGHQSKDGCQGNCECEECSFHLRVLLSLFPLGTLLVPTGVTKTKGGFANFLWTLQLENLLLGQGPCRHAVRSLGWSPECPYPFLITLAGSNRRGESSNTSLRSSMPVSRSVCGMGRSTRLVCMSIRIS